MEVGGPHQGWDLDLVGEGVVKTQKMMKFVYCSGSELVHCCLTKAGEQGTTAWAGMEGAPLPISGVLEAKQLQLEKTNRKTPLGGSQAQCGKSTAAVPGDTAWQGIHMIVNFNGMSTNVWQEFN